MIEQIKSAFAIAGDVFKAFPDMFNFVSSALVYLPAWLSASITFALACRAFSVIYHKDPGGSV